MYVEKATVGTRMIDPKECFGKVKLSGLCGESGMSGRVQEPLREIIRHKSSVNELQKH